MHAGMEELRNLASAYVCEDLLDEKQLAVKRHMAECDECYRIFCTEYYMMYELTKAGLISQESLALSKPWESYLVKIQWIKDKMDIILGKDTEENYFGDFFQVPQFAMARGAEMEEKDQYQNEKSEYTRIIYQGNKLRIQVDGDEFPVEKMCVWLRDGEISEKYSFVYDEETECYGVILDMSRYSPEAVITIVEEENAEE